MAFLQQSIQIGVTATVAGAGVSTVIPAPAASPSDITPKRLRVMSAVLVASAALSLKLQSHTTTGIATGSIPLAVNGQLILPYNPDGWFNCAFGEALDLSISAAGTVSGSINYITE